MCENFVAFGLILQLKLLPKPSRLGMFMKILNFCVFNKMCQIERYCDSLQNEGSTT